MELDYKKQFFNHFFFHRQPNENNFLNLPIQQRLETTAADKDPTEVDGLGSEDSEARFPPRNISSSSKLVRAIECTKSRILFVSLELPIYRMKKNTIKS